MLSPFACHIDHYDPGIMTQANGLNTYIHIQFRRKGLSTACFELTTVKKANTFFLQTGYFGDILHCPDEAVCIHEVNDLK